MMRLLALVALACASASRAEPAIVISDVFEAFPAVNGSLPTNGRLVLFGSDVSDIAFVRVRDDGTEDPLVHEQIATGNDATCVVTLDALTAGEIVNIASRCGGCFFTGTWTVIDFVDQVAPTFDDGPTSVEVGPGRDAFTSFINGYNVSVTLPGARDDSGNVLVRVLGDGFTGHSQPGLARVDLFFAGAEERTVCMDAVAIDAAGKLTQFGADSADQVCAELKDDGGGCAHTSAPPFAGLLAVLASLSIIRTVRGKKSLRSAPSWRPLSRQQFLKSAR